MKPVGIFVFGRKTAAPPTVKPSEERTTEIAVTDSETNSSLYEKHFTVKRNLPTPGGPVKATPEMLSQFVMVENASVPGGLEPEMDRMQQLANQTYDSPSPDDYM